MFQTFIFVLFSIPVLMHNSVNCVSELYENVFFYTLLSTLQGGFDTQKIDFWCSITLKGLK